MKCSQLQVSYSGDRLIKTVRINEKKHSMVCKSFTFWSELTTNSVFNHFFLLSQFVHFWLLQNWNSKSEWSLRCRLETISLTDISKMFQQLKSVTTFYCLDFSWWNKIHKFKKNKLQKKISVCAETFYQIHNRKFLTMYTKQWPIHSKTI